MHHRHALVVDDETLVRTTIRDILLAYDWHVTEAVDGEDALRRHRPEEHDLVVLDLIMPGRDGVATLRALRERAPDVPVLVVSGYAAPGMVQAALASPPSRFLPKPFRAAQLMAAVAALLQVVAQVS